ncbi:MAG: hypothetical protein NTW83_03880 [Cyanobacteria bacterium]|nr:hypothetical protein [Cyanobacteriota bacterium]
MSPPHRQSLAQISAELGIHVVTLYNWRKTWRLQGEVVPASQKDPEGWGATDKFTVVLETAGPSSGRMPCAGAEPAGAANLQEWCGPRHSDHLHERVAGLTRSSCRLLTLGQAQKSLP